MPSIMFQVPVILHYILLFIKKFVRAKGLGCLAMMSITTLKRSPCWFLNSQNDTSILATTTTGQLQRKSQKLHCSITLIALTEKGNTFYKDTYLGIVDRQFPYVINIKVD